MRRTHFTVEKHRTASDGESMIAGKQIQVD